MTDLDKFQPEGERIHPFDVYALLDDGDWEDLHFKQASPAAIDEADFQRNLNKLGCVIAYKNKTYFQTVTEPVKTEKGKRLESWTPTKERAFADITNKWEGDPMKVHIKFECGHEWDILSPGAGDPIGLYAKSCTPASDGTIYVHDICKCSECGNLNSAFDALE